MKMFLPGGPPPFPEKRTTNKLERLIKARQDSSSSPPPVPQGRQDFPSTKGQQVVVNKVTMQDSKPGVVEEVRTLTSKRRIPTPRKSVSSSTETLEGMMSSRKSVDILNEVSLEDADTSSFVLISAPIRDRSDFLPKFIQSIHSLDYPKENIGLHFILNDCVENSKGVLENLKKTYGVPFRFFVIEEHNLNAPQDKRSSVRLKHIYRNLALLRTKTMDLAVKYDADCLIVECVCSDESIHRARMENRQRHIPGWHELDWDDVESVKSYFAPWDETRLVVDTVALLDENVNTVLDWLRNPK